MTDNSNILAAQKRVFRLAARDHGLTLKAISLDTRIGYSTVQTWASGKAVMGLQGFHLLSTVLPTELLSLLLPEGVQIVHAPDDIDHDALCELAEDYVTTKMAAHRADSPAGPEICPDKEAPVLDGKAAKLKAVRP